MRPCSSGRNRSAPACRSRFAALSNPLRPAVPRRRRPLTDFRNERADDRNRKPQSNDTAERQRGVRHKGAAGYLLGRTGIVVGTRAARVVWQELSPKEARHKRIALIGRSRGCLFPRLHSALLSEDRVTYRSKSPDGAVGRARRIDDVVLAVPLMAAGLRASYAMRRLRCRDGGQEMPARIGAGWRRSAGARGRSHRRPRCRRAAWVRCRAEAS